MGSLVVIELERAAENDPASLDTVYPHIRGFLELLEQAPTLHDVLSRTVDEVQRLTGLDRVLVYRFDDLRAGQAIAGPAVVEYSGSTLFLPPGWDARFDAMMNAHLSRVAPPADTAEAQAASFKEPA